MSNTEDRSIRYATLAKSPYVDVRLFVANRVDCPENLLELLSDDVSREVRLAVAGNRNTRPEVLAELSGPKNKTLMDLSGYSAEVALYKSNLEKARMWKALARNPNCPFDLLARLESFQDTGTKVEIARNYSCPEDLLDKLASSTNDEVLFAVVEHPNCPESALYKLADNANPGLRKKAVERLLS